MTALAVRAPAPPRVRRRVAWVGYALATLLVVYAFVAPLLIDPTAMVVQPSRKFSPPFDLILLGTDHLGRDLTLLIAVGCGPLFSSLFASS